MTGSVTINGTRYQVTIEDLTPADVLTVFRTDTSILKTDSLLLHAAGTEQNSAKKVLMTHLVSMLAASVAEDNVLTIEPYYDENGVYHGMYWHFNSDWLRRNDTGGMIRVDDTAAEIALAADQAVRATEAAKTAAGNANQKAQEANAARLNAQAAADEWNNTYKQQVGQAILDAQGADNLDASLDGMTVTIIGRDGQAKSVSIGYEIYKTYETVADMQADVANVPVGKFVIIATKDPTDPDNAKLYSRSSQGDFRFLADLDQASSAAWADWLENHKQQIADATSYALQQGDYAKTQGDYAKTQGDYAKTQGDHPPRVNPTTNYWQYYNPTTEQYEDTTVYAKGDNIDYSTMTEQEKEDLSARVVQQVTADNVLGPAYDSKRECVVFPITMAVRYDDSRECVVFG